MSETWPVYDLFSPILIGNYIRFETAMKVIRNAEAENKAEAVIAKFKIAKEYYEQLKNSEIQAPLLGLSLKYDEASSILSVEPDAAFVTAYENKIMQDVARKQSDDCKVRYSKFIEVLPE